MIDGVPGKATEARFFGSCALGPAAGSPGQAGVTRSRAADRHGLRAATPAACAACGLCSGN